MNNITTALIETLNNYTTGSIVELDGDNKLENDDNLLYLITPLALVSKKQNHHNSQDVSPVTLSEEWPRLARLLLLTILSVIGSVGNVFLISSVMIEDNLKKAGNAFIVNIALADLLVTSILMPASVIILLSGVQDDSSDVVCKFQWFLAACSLLVSVLTLAVTAIENYMRLCTIEETQWFGRSNVTAILLLIWFIASVSSGLQYVYTASFDYCNRKNVHSPLTTYETSVIVSLVLVPLLITFFVHIRILIDAKKVMSQPNFKPNSVFKSNLSIARSNFYSFLVFVLFWLPFSVVFALSTSTSTKTINDRVFYHTAWIGLSKSCFHNIIYCITNRHFRSAYVNLFNYCCCKTTVSVSRRRNEVNRTDVRVHIIPGYNMYSYTSPQRSGGATHWSKRDCHEL